MSIATQHLAANSARQNSSRWHKPPGSWTDAELVVSVPTLPPTAQARLTDIARQRGRVLHFAQPDSSMSCERLGLETPAGLTLTDQQVQSSWHRAPYALPVRMVRYETGSRHGVPLDTAVVSTGGNRADFLARVARVTERLVADALCDISRGDPGLSFDPAAVNGSLLPPRIDRMRTVWRTRLFAEWWSIGQTSTSLQEILRTGAVTDVRWVAPKRGSAYLADPFPWPGRNSVLCEEMPLTDGTGRIIALPLASDGAPQAATVVLEDGAHHSYPSTFTEGAEVYLLPESTDRGATTLYRLSPHSPLTPICTIAPGMRLADPTPFRHAGQYWIACTDLDFGEHDNLCLLYADRLTGPWRFHRCRPVKIDVCGARSAGTPFVLDGQLYRPGQDCARGYGAGVVIHRVDVLSPDHFQETVVARLRPDPSGPFPDGLHTLNADATRVWIDGKRYVFDPAGIGRKLIRRIRSMTKWGGGPAE